MRRLLVVLALALTGVVVAAAPASAHPLGNFSVNTYAALTLHPDRVDATVVADIAELPTLQDPAPTCAEAAAALAVIVGGRAVRWTVADESLVSAPGAGGLDTTRLSCTLTGPAALGSSLEITVTNGFRADRIGWRELVAAGGPGVALSGSPLPVAGTSDELRRYPDDLLSSPPDVRSASFTATPGSSPAGAAAAAGVSSGSSPFGTSGPLAGAERRLEGVAGGREITPWIGLLAVLLALLLGAGHAALPGHGKTVMAAFLAGRRGRPRDAVAVGATVTVTHTGGVLILGLVLTTVAGIAGETILGYLGLASGILVTAIGASALITALRRRRSLDDHTHSHGPGHSHSHGHSHGPGGGHSERHALGEHSHDYARARTLAGGAATAVLDAADHTPHHGHDHPSNHRHHHDHGPGRWSIAGLGIAGGLVPSPSALIVLLGAAALGRTVFGILLVIAYGIGMAATLTAAGLLLIKLRDRLDGRFPRLTRWRALLPPITAALILAVGIGLAARALLTIA